MDEDFVFEVSSDEETEIETQQKEEENKTTQSPWEFAVYSESVAEEHARTSTTSTDEKISNIRQKLSLQIDEDASDSEPEDKQESFKPQDHQIKDLNLSRPLLRACQASGYHKPQDDPIKEVDPKSFFSPSHGVLFHANSFMELNLSRPLLRACQALGYHKPTNIQAACIPHAMAGRDICGSAMTGTGKTAAYTLPVLERLLFRNKRVHAIRVLVLTPTRELALQVHSEIGQLKQFTDISCCLVVGGLSAQEQAASLRSMPDIVVATPGRMIDHLRNTQSVHLEDLAVLILDEADRLLELGFNAEIRELVRSCHRREQTMLFSATMTEEIDELIKFSLKKPLRISADPSTKRPPNLTEEFVRIRRMREVNQEAVLLAMCSTNFTSKVIIFSGTRQAAHRLKILFGLAGFKAAELHRDRSPYQCLEALELFRKQEVDFLIATEVAARGLDITGVKTVINFECPRDFTRYQHRVGRTARAGKGGHAVTFVTDNDRPVLKSIEKESDSKLRSRTVAQNIVNKWCQIIEQLEDQVNEVLEEEREESAIRKAEMEATKAENMITHKDEIFSRPKKTWFITNKEKIRIANEAKTNVRKDKNSAKEVVSAQQAEDLKMKEKRKREREKNMPRKKRRRLEAAREVLEDDFRTEGGKSKGKLLVDAAYRQAKAVKALSKAQGARKVAKNEQKASKRPSQRSKSKPEEMRELFQSDMSEKKQKGRVRGAGTKKHKRSFKSKLRYKRK